MLTLKASQKLVEELAALALELGMTRHAAALEALTVGTAALRGKADPRSPAALAELVADRVVAKLASERGETTPAAPAPVAPAAAPVADPAPAPVVKASGRPHKGTAGAVPRRPGDYQIGGRRKTDPPEGSAAAFLLAWRKGRGLSQEQAAELVGVTRKSWQRWETGDRAPEAGVVERVKAL